MNKYIRALLITFGVCLAIGGGLLIAGIALGGTLDDASVVIGKKPFAVGDMFEHGIFSDDTIESIKDDYVWNKENDKNRDKEKDDYEIGM